MPDDDPNNVNNLGHPSTTPAGRPRREGWLERHERYCARAAQGGLDLVFLGDSLTQRWETAPEVWNPVRFGDPPRLGGLNPHVFDPSLTSLPDFSILSSMNSLRQVGLYRRVHVPTEKRFLTPNA